MHSWLILIGVRWIIRFLLICYYVNSLDLVFLVSSSMEGASFIVLWTAKLEGNSNEVSLSCYSLKFLLRLENKLLLQAKSFLEQGFLIWSEVEIMLYVYFFMVVSLVTKICICKYKFDYDALHKFKIYSEVSSQPRTNLLLHNNS